MFARPWLRVLLFSCSACSLAGCGESDGTLGTGGNGGASSDACPMALPLAEGEAATDRGLVRGFEDGNSWAYLGVPFAAPPVGDRRFRPPAQAACWGELDALDFGSECRQWDENGELTGDEDCLYLNVWVPKAPAAEASGYPVLFFVHGGAHQQGSASALTAGLRIYAGESLAENTGSIVVTINYRLGPFGYLSHPALTAEGSEGPGNYGTLDQIAALEWVRDNVANFGGDPARVLLFGESAGALSTCILLASPKAAGLFSSALMQSGACVAEALADAEATGADLAEALACDATAVPQCLRDASVEAIIATVPPTFNIAGATPPPYRPVVDGTVLPDAPLAIIGRGEHHQVPVVVGSNSEETGAAVPPITTEEQYETAVRGFAGPVGGETLVDAVLQAYPVSDYPSPRRAFIAVTSDPKFVCSARSSALALAAAQDQPVYRYVFSYVAENAGVVAQANGAVHGVELLYLFGHLEVETPAGTYQPTATDWAMSSALQQFWGQLAATGDPGGAPAWPRYLPEDEAHEVLDQPLGTGNAFRKPQCEFWQSALGL